MKPFDLPKRDALSASEKTMPGHAANGAANDLRSYLQRSAVLRSRALAETSRRSEPHASGLSNGGIGAAFKSLDAVLDHLRADLPADAPPVVLVMAARPEIDASRDAIRIARAQASECRLGILVDLNHGTITVSDQLDIPRAPGFAELASGRAGFEDVVHIDDETPLQIIPAGDRAVTIGTKRDGERLARILDALMQVYDAVVLHAGRETALMHQPHLAGRLHAVIAVLASGEGKNIDQVLAEFAAFNCPVLSLEQSGERRWFSRRSA
jgi:Mrp family chromosome partitioning ATPase